MRYKYPKGNGVYRFSSLVHITTEDTYTTAKSIEQAANFFNRRFKEMLGYIPASNVTIDNKKIVEVK